MPSTVIAHMNYDALREILRIHFVSGLVYEYKKVPEKVYAALKQSGSKGSFLNQHIKGNYEYKKID